MFISIGLWLAGLLGKTPGKGLARGIGIVVAVASLAVVLSVGKCAYDRNVIEWHSLKGQKEARKAEHKADENAVVRDEQISNDARTVEGVITNARQAHPEDVRKPSGPATTSVLDELRRQERNRSSKAR